MSKISILIVGSAVVSAAFAVEPVCRPASAVTVPLESVTASIESVTVNEASVRASISPIPPSQNQLADAARSAKASVEERLAALAKVQDQDVLFRLVFKPGSDTNSAIRVTALKSLAELDVIRYMEVKCSDCRIREAAKERLDAVYGENRDRQVEQCEPTFRSYARRMRGGR